MVGLCRILAPLAQAGWPPCSPTLADGPPAFGPQPFALHFHKNRRAVLLAPVRPLPVQLCWMDLKKRRKVAVLNTGRVKAHQHGLCMAGISPAYILVTGVEPCARQCSQKQPRTRQHFERRPLPPKAAASHNGRGRASTGAALLAAADVATGAAPALAAFFSASRAMAAFSSSLPAGANFMESELTQWRVLRCVKPSPSNTCPQTPVAVGANNLYPAAIGIGHTAHCASHFLVKAGPAAAGFKLVIRMVERHAAVLAANVGSCRVIINIFAAVGRFCSLAQQHIGLKPRKEAAWDRSFASKPPDLLPEPRPPWATGQYSATAMGCKQGEKSTVQIWPYAPPGAAVVVLLHKHRAEHVEGMARHKVLALA